MNNLSFWLKTGISDHISYRKKIKSIFGAMEFWFLWKQTPSHKDFPYNFSKVVTSTVLSGHLRAISKINLLTQCSISIPPKKGVLMDYRASCLRHKYLQQPVLLHISLWLNGTKYSRMDQVKFFKRLSSKNFTWSILQYFVPNTNQTSF